MLEMTEQQMAAVRAPLREEAARRFTYLLRDAWPEDIVPLGPDQAYARVLAEIDAGIEAGFSSQRDLFLFVQLAVILGWDYADRPDTAWVDAILFDADMGSPAARLRTVMAMLDG